MALKIGSDRYHNCTSRNHESLGAMYVAFFGNLKPGIIPAHHCPID